MWEDFGLQLSKLPSKIQRHSQGGRLAEASGEEDGVWKNSTILTPERTKKYLISTLPIGLYFLFYVFVIDVSEMEREKTWH